MPARYKDVPRPGTSFNYDEYVPQDPTYDQFYSDAYYFEGDNRTEQEQQRYGAHAMPLFGRGLIGLNYLPQVVVDEQGYPQPIGRAKWGTFAMRPFPSKNSGEKVQLDYRNSADDESDKRRRREDWLYNLMRERMRLD